MTPVGSAPVREGDLLAGKYRVERVLGAGGMGVVVAARHIELDQLVALKFVREDAMASDDAVERFLREARAAVRLKSEHVARVLDVGKLESGAPYMVMEFLEGNDLGKILAQNGPLPFDTAADWILQACEAVAEAHGAGIVHRDLKPENLFLARTVGGVQKIKVLDFGVSKALGGGPSGELSGLTRTRAMLGSPLYMAPEQMRSSRDVDVRVDVWALGVVLFQLVTQRFPFEAETMPELCLKVVTEQPLKASAVRADVPAGICDVISQCLEKDPNKRFANAAELASALEPFVHPGSRVLADRARLAMGVASGARSMPRTVVASAPTLLNDASSLSAPGVTSAPWERLATQPTPRAAGSWRLPLAIAVVVAGCAGGLFLFPRSRAGGDSARSGTPVAMKTDPAPAAAPPPVASTLPPPSGRPPPDAVIPSRPAEIASTQAAGAPSVSAPSPAAAAPGPAKIKPPAPTHPAPARAVSTDDDIPTIR
jgi:serine/threonine protein kinase